MLIFRGSAVYRLLFWLSSLTVLIGPAPWSTARGSAPTATSAPAPSPLAWRSLRAPCLPAPGPVYVSKRSALGRLTPNAPIEISSEASFSERFGCPSGVDWTRERLVLLLLQVGSMDAIRLDQATDAGGAHSLRFRVTCAAGYDDGARGIAGSHVFFALLLPASFSAIDVKYKYFNVQTSKYQNVMTDCAKVPRARQLR